FLLGEALPALSVRTALPASYDRVVAAGLLAVDGEHVRAAVDLRPTRAGDDDLLLTSDLAEAATGRGIRPDHVLGLVGASVTLAHLTIRRPVPRALDLGTGSGIQALGLAAHSDEVVATDVSPRALDLAAFNRDLNGAAGIELRRGSLWDPVATDTFDLIVSNPPFVISPRGGTLPTYTYRDGGRAGDELRAGLLTGLPRLLGPGGVAQMLGNWEVRADGPWHERIGRWVRATGLDAWVIQRELLDPAQY